MAFFLHAGPLAAQGEESLVRKADLHREPQGTPLVTLPAGAPIETGDDKGDWREVTVEGWIYTPSVRPTRRDGFDVVVSEEGGENLRRSPNGPIVGRAREGTLFERVEQKGKWTRVRRAGWVPKRAVPAPPPPRRKREAAPQRATAPAPAPAAAVPAPPPEAAAADRVQAARDADLSATPDGPVYGTLRQGTPMRVVARAGEWSRVQLEGWVRDAELQAAEGGALVGITAAEIRSAPDRFVGQTVEWRLQLIAVQTADELRPELPPGQPYLLTRGPLPEPGFVYVAIPPARAGAFRALQPLQELVVRVAIRAARSRYLTTPVVELVSVVSGVEGMQDR